MLQLSDCGRSVDVDGLTGMVGAAADGCDTKSIVGASFHTDSWFWPGNFDFTALDSSLSNFFACAGHNAVAVSYGSILDDKISLRIDICIHI